jgi:hypothetical protein
MILVLPIHRGFDAAERLDWGWEGVDLIIGELSRSSKVFAVEKEWQVNAGHEDVDEPKRGRMMGRRNDNSMVRNLFRFVQPRPGRRTGQCGQYVGFLSVSRLSVGRCMFLMVRRRCWFFLRL